jgi:hypothetical protein
VVCLDPLQRLHLCLCLCLCLCPPVPCWPLVTQTSRPLFLLVERTPSYIALKPPWRVTGFHDQAIGPKVLSLLMKDRIRNNQSLMF